MDKIRSESGTMTIGELRATLANIPTEYDDKPVWLDLDDNWGADLCAARMYGTLYLRNYNFQCCEECG